MLNAWYSRLLLIATGKQEIITHFHRQIWLSINPWNYNANAVSGIDATNAKAPIERKWVVWLPWDTKWNAWRKSVEFGFYGVHFRSYLSHKTSNSKSPSFESVDFDKCSFGTKFEGESFLACSRPLLPMLSWLLGVKLSFRPMHAMVRNDSLILR